jgi:hypothetical protein
MTKAIMSANIRKQASKHALDFLAFAIARRGRESQVCVGDCFVVLKRRRAPPLQSTMGQTSEIQSCDFVVADINFWWWLNPTLVLSHEHPMAC